MTQFNVGDRVERLMSDSQANARRNRDLLKARKLGRKQATFLGCAAAAMHGDEAYVVQALTDKGGLVLRGFSAVVSPKDVKLSEKPVIR